MPILLVLFVSFEGEEAGEHVMRIGKAITPQLHLSIKRLTFMGCKIELKKFSFKIQALQFLLITFSTCLLIDSCNLTKPISNWLHFISDGNRMIQSFDANQSVP